MKFLKTSDSEFSSFQEKARYKFIWRLNAAFIGVTFFLTGFSFFADDRYVHLYLVVFLVASAALFFLTYFKIYKLVANILYLTICVILFFSIFSVPEGLHLQEALWMVVLILSAFFTLGNFWGIFYLAANTILYSLYYNYLFEGMGTIQDTILPNVMVLMTVELIVSMFLIGFVMFQYEIINKHALKNASDAYEDLKKEKQIVEHQNKEKTILLQEIHHRVKNNLQVIVSLLRIQSRELKSTEAQEGFQDSITRILTMSLIHQKLYEKESLMNIDIKDYLNTLMKNLIETGSTQENVVFSVESSLNSVSAKSIVPLGLIINELVSNSLKYAFENSGRIELKLSPDKSSGFTMIYFDNGRWITNENSTFGTQLIEIFTEQLDGTFERKITDEGTYYHFSLNDVGVI